MATPLCPFCGAGGGGALVCCGIARSASGVPRGCWAVALVLCTVVLRALASSHLAAHQQRGGVVLGACVDLGPCLAQKRGAAGRATARSRVERRGTRVMTSHRLLDEGYAHLPHLPRLGRGARDEHVQLVPAEAGGLYGGEHHAGALGPIEQAAEEERRPVPRDVAK